MKRLLAMILTLALLFAGCGGKTMEPDGELPAGQTNAEQAENVVNGEEEKAETEKDSWISPVIEWFSSLFDSGKDGNSLKEGANAVTIPDRNIPTGLLWLDLAVTEEEIFWCEDGRVFRFDPREEGESEGTLFYEGIYVTKLASDGERLAVCSADGQVKIGVPGEEGFGDPADLRLPVPDGCMVSGLVLTEDTVVFLWRSEENGPDRLGFYSLVSGDFIEDTPMENSVCLLCPGGGSRIFVFWASRTAVSLSLFYSFDVHAMKRIANYPIPSGQQFNAIGYNPAADRLYALDQSGGVSGSFLHVWDPDDPSGSEKIEPHDSIRKTPTKLLFLSGSAVVLKPVEGLITVCGDYLAEDGVVTVLVPETNRIVQDSLGHIAYVLKRDHGVKLTVKRMKEEAINTKLLAQDDDFDLYFADGRLLNLNYPVWEPLEDFPLIQEKTALFFDDIVRICSVNGHIFGLPYFMQLGNCFLPWNESVARACGVKKPEPGWTLDDYTALAKELREKGYYAGWRMTAVGLEEYMWNFFDPFGTGTINDDGTILRKYLLWEKELYDNDLLFDGNWQEAMDSGKVLFVGHASSYILYGNRETIVTRPTFDGVERYSDASSFFLMNPQSKHKEAASAVLAEMFSPDNVEYTTPNRSVYYFKDFSLYTFNYVVNWQESLDRAKTPEERAEREAKMKADMEESREEEIRSGHYTDIWNMDEETKERYDFYLHVMAHYRLGRSYNEEWLRFAAAEEDKYLNDEQDLDYTVKRILERAKMVLEG